MHRRVGASLSINPCQVLIVHAKSLVELYLSVARTKRQLESEQKITVMFTETKTCFRRLEVKWADKTFKWRIYFGKRREQPKKNCKSIKRLSYKDKLKRWNSNRRSWRIRLREIERWSACAESEMNNWRSKYKSIKMKKHLKKWRKCKNKRNKMRRIGSESRGVKSTLRDSEEISRTLRCRKNWLKTCLWLLSLD